MGSPVHQAPHTVILLTILHDQVHTAIKHLYFNKLKHIGTYVYSHQWSFPIVHTQVVKLPDWALGPTVITVDLSYTKSTQVSDIIELCNILRCWHVVCTLHACSCLHILVGVPPPPTAAPPTPVPHC